MGRSKIRTPPSSVYKRINAEEGQDLFSLVPEDKTQNNGHELQEATSEFNIGKAFVTNCKSLTEEMITQRVIVAY